MRTFFISDPHFGHEKMVTTFVRPDGTPARKFDSVEEMDEVMVQGWNDVVRDVDKVYLLGDVAMSRAHMARVMARLRGRKNLIRGNHDILSTQDYLKFFKQVYGMRVLPEHGLVLTHAPVAPWATGGRVSVHGHLHSNTPLVYRRYNQIYVNVSVENTNYIPIELSQLEYLVAADVGLRGPSYFASEVTIHEP